MARCNRLGIEGGAYSWNRRTSESVRVAGGSWIHPLGCLNVTLVSCRPGLPWTKSCRTLRALTAATAAAGPDSLTAAYRSYVNAAIDDFEAAKAPARLAACVMEPLLQGAGGMLVVEPGFQRALAEVCRTRQLPLILDEVFSGLYRTGALTAAARLGITPDVACLGKLLTGGAAPMAVTLATREVFEAFAGPSKLFALLHGHSYTAYPVGCAAAVASLELLSNAETNPNLCAPGRCPKNPTCTTPCGRLLPIWDEQHAVSVLSYHPLVSRIAAVGTVLAVELATTASATASSAQSSGGGYGSVSAVQVVRRLRDVYGIYARPLGPVVYLMVPPTARRETASWLADCLARALDECTAPAVADSTLTEADGVVV
ncbi:hypothetical protein Vretimale_15413 [Volvox reticuliferus]|uniref:Adenosylmethionine-8-amino-7-oxononanoate aminotransferase n=1 Tax=Volvox reticuliferus TaxID=1737510 RepID=A0A8J4GR81_9CHLO|nr:hypothetical protein Vretimale_15413 [Volvox reticuliferus]